MTRFVRIALLVLAGIILVVTPVFAYLYKAPVAIAENASTSYDMLPVLWNQNNTWLAANGFMNSTANDTRVQTLGGLNKPWMVADNKTLTAIPVPANSQTNLYFTTGESEASAMDIIVGYGGYITRADDPGWELGSNFTVEQKGWIDTTATSNNNLVYKEGAFKSWVSGTGNVTAGIFAWTTPTADNDPSATWSSDNLSRDDNTGTAALDNVAQSSWSGYLELSVASAQWCDKVRFWVANDSDARISTEVSVRYGGEAHIIYFVTTAGGEWITGNLTELQQVDQVKIRFQNSDPAAAYNCYIHEVDFGFYTPSVTATGVSTGKHTVIAESGEIAVSVGDGTLLYNGYIYITGRSTPGTIAKVNASDYSDVTIVPIMRGITNSGSIDAIVETGGYLWVGDFGLGGYLYKIDPSTLAVVDYWHILQGYNYIYSLATDGSFIYAGGIGYGDSGEIGKFNIATEAITDVELAYTGAMHSLIEDGDYLYGHTIGSNRKVLKILKSDLSLVSSVVLDASFSDDVVQDTNYLYYQALAVGPFTVVRFAKSDLSSTVLYPVSGAGDGMAKIGDILLSALTYATGSTYFLRVIDMPRFAETGIITSLLGLTNTALKINEIIVDGDYIHILRWGLAPPYHIFLAKFDMSSVGTTPGIPSGEHTIKTTYDGTNLKIFVDDMVTPGDTAAWVGTVPGNDNDWVIMSNATPYSDYYRHTVNETLVGWYQPTSMILTTVMPDRAGTAENGVITWGSNPAGVGTTLGSMVSSGQPGIGTTTDTSTGDILPVVGGTDWRPDAGVSVTLQANPMRPIVTAISDNTTLSEYQVWVWFGIIFVVFITILVGANVRGHHLITGIAASAAIILLIVWTVFPWWVLTVIVLAIWGGLVSERSPSL